MKINLGTFTLEIDHNNDAPTQIKLEPTHPAKVAKSRVTVSDVLSVTESLDEEGRIIAVSIAYEPVSTFILPQAGGGDDLPPPDDGGY